jgi:phenylalanyl-tRNA synthetase alpha chain
MGEAAKADMPNMDLLALKNRLLQDIAKTTDLSGLEALRVAALGKKGQVTELLKQLGTLPAEARKDFGAAVNLLKEDIAAALDAKQKSLGDQALESRLESERIDITLSPRPAPRGSIHPLTQTTEDLISIFAEMGFMVAEGPDIETDFYNFTALNVPPDHPAREMQDTFYLPPSQTDTLVLRTQTSPVQIRTMQKQKPPIRIIAPGRTYRCDYDMTHSPMFHQIEGLVIDEKTNMSHLKGTLLDFLRAFFGVKDLPMRFRPSYFPFVEPGAEVDIGCSRKGGELKLGNYGDWLEILGCGMVHPTVIKNCGLDPEIYQGFAFGAGLERLAMLKYGIPDLRTFFESDLRWLKHYGFMPLDIPNVARG